MSEAEIIRLIFVDILIPILTAVIGFFVGKEVYIKKVNTIKNKGKNNKNTINTGTIIENLVSQTSNEMRVLNYKGIRQYIVDNAIFVYDDCDNSKAMMLRDGIIYILRFSQFEDEQPNGKDVDGVGKYLKENKVDEMLQRSMIEILCKIEDKKGEDLVNIFYNL